MQTLGASNPHNNNKDKHRSGQRITGDTVDRVFTQNGGLENQVCSQLTNSLVTPELSDH